MMMNRFQTLGFQFQLAPLHNGHFTYQLPSIAWKDIQNEVSNRGRKFYIKFSEIDFSQKKEAKERRRHLLGNDPKAAIGSPEIRCNWADTGGGDKKTRAFASTSSIKHIVSHFSLVTWGPIVDSQGTGSKLVLDWIRCGIYDTREETCDDDDDCEQKKSMAGLIPYGLGLAELLAASSTRI